MATVKTRFAPSPTGFLHVGNLRTALVNWLFTRQTGGLFVLRIDDTDCDRSRVQYEAAIGEDLRWLGLNWDDKINQLDRKSRYEEAQAKLMQSNRLYACYETPQELEMQRKMLAGRGLPPIYKRATAEQTRKYEAEGRKPHYRFRLHDEEIIWTDLIRGEVRLKASHMSDPVLVREGGVPLYTLASVVDDHELAITHVIRGEDHVSNTAVQVQLSRALGYTPPQFAHLALLKTKEGGLSKREGGGDIRGLREAGILPMAVNSYLARIGTSDAIEPFADMQPLVAGFDFTKFGRAPAHYDEQELLRLNEKLLHQLPFEAVADKLAFLDRDFWIAIRRNIKTLNEAQQWWKIVHELSPDKSGDMGYLHAALTLLPPQPWNDDTWGQWTKAVSGATGRTGKELFMPLRIALTGLPHGPEMKFLLQILGRDKVVQRLS